MIRPFLAAASLLAAFSPSPTAAQDSTAAQDTTIIAVVATSDVHGRAMHWDYARDQEAPWGLTRVATLVDSLRRRYAGNVIVLDDGDLIQGNAMAAVYSAPETDVINPMIDVLNSIGYDAMVLGNHEFNFGLATLNRILRDASFSVLGANVFPVGSDTPAYRSSILMRRGGVRVGVTGLTTPGSVVWDRAHLQGALEIRPIIPVARAALTALENNGADLTIALVHSGMVGASSYTSGSVGDENVTARMALLQPKPDLVIAGHSHEWFADSVIQGVHFMQPRNWAQGAAVAYVTMVGDETGYRVASIRSEHVDLATIAPSVALTRRLAGAHEAVRRWTSATIAAANGNWSARFARVEDTPIVDFINEVQRRASGAQLSAAAAFTTDAELGPGAVTYGDIAAVYPYENTLKAVLIDGATLRAYLERSAAYFNVYSQGAPFADSTVPGYDYDMISGIDYVIDISRPAGSRIRQMVFEGRAVTPTDTFTLAVNSYRQAGGGRYDMFARLPVVYDRGENIRDLLMEAARTIGTINSGDYYEENWRLVPTEAANDIRQRLGGSVRSGTVVLRILATSGIRGRMQPDTATWSGGRQVGGAVATEYWLDSLSRECRCSTLRLDGGNALSGTPIADFSAGRVVVDAFNIMGVRAAALALQDLGIDPDTLRSLSDRADFELLSVNFIEASTGRTPDWTRSWIMAEEGGLRTAVLGVTWITGADTASFGDFRVEPPESRLRQALAAAHVSSPNQTVVLTDARLSCTGPNCDGELIDFAARFDSTEITIIVAPGSGPPINTSVNGISIVAPGSPARIGVMDVVRAPDGELDIAVAIENLWAGAGANPGLAAMIASNQETTDRIVGRRIATLRTDISRSDAPEYPLGRLVADAVRNGARTEAAIVPNTHIRDNLPRGALTYGDLFQVLSVNEPVLILEVPGELLEETLEWVLFEARPSAHVSGLVVRYDPERTPGRRIRDLRFPDGERIRDNDVYTLAVPASVHAGANQFPMLFRVEARSAGTSELDALANYLQRLPQPVQAPRTQRFTIDR